MKHEDTFKIAIAQSKIGNDVKVNADRICELIVRASIQKARLVLFPEGALSGYATSHFNHPDQFDHSKISFQLRRICELAAQHNIWVVVGACHSIEGTNRPFNCQYVVSDKGMLVERSDKIYLSHTELESWYTPAASIPKTITIDDFKFGFAICIEATMPHHFQQLEELDVDCVLYSSMANTDLFETLLRGNAAAFSYWIAASEAVQTNHEFCSMLIDPNGKVERKASMKGNQNLIITNLDRKDPRYEVQLNLAKPWRRKARIGNIYRTKRVNTS